MAQAASPTTKTIVYFPTAFRSAAIASVVEAVTPNRATSDQPIRRPNFASGLTDDSDMPVKFVTRGTGAPGRPFVFARRGVAAVGIAGIGKLALASCHVPWEPVIRDFREARLVRRTLGVTVIVIGRVGDSNWRRARFERLGP